MTTIEPAKSAATAPVIDKQASAKRKPANSPTAAIGDAADLVTLEQLAREMKIPPRDARMMLRLAAKQTELYPTLGKEHVARQPWSWTPGSKALDEARKALSTPDQD